MKKFKGYDVVDNYPEDGWLKGYFYVADEDIKGGNNERSQAYRDLGSIKHKDFTLNLLNIRPGEKVLDVGCADGAITVYCGLMGAKVSGVDISCASVEKANKYLEKYGIDGKASVQDARKIEFSDNHFDKVISSDFFEHLSNKDNILVLKEIKRVLRPGGILVIKTPNLTYLRFSKLFKRIKRTIQFKNPFQVVIPHTTGSEHQHVGLIGRKKMVKIIRAAGFMNFSFYHDNNSNVENKSYFLASLLAKTPLLKDIFSEEIIVVIYKPIILSLFP